MIRPLLLALVLATAAQATDSLSPSVVSDGTCYYRDAAAGTTARGVAWQSQTLSLLVKNEGATDLLVKFIRRLDASGNNTIFDPDTPGELTAPADRTWSEVQVIGSGKSLVFDVRRSRGLVYDRASGSGAVTFRVID